MTKKQKQITKLEQKRIHNRNYTARRRLYIANLGKERLFLRSLCAGLAIALAVVVIKSFF